MNPEVVDQLLLEPAIVFGSLPPAGRDLDLLVSRTEKHRLGRALAAVGWDQRGKTFVRFTEGTAFAVDLVDLDGWAPNREVATLLREKARPLPGHSHLTAPPPHQQLLILVRRFGEGMELDAKKRARLAAFDQDDWAAATSEAAAWGLTDMVSELAWRLSRELVSTSTAPRRGPGQKRGWVISLSGLDGSGKSTQGQHLRTALEALGYEVAIEWTKIARDPVLAAVAKPVKAALKRFAPKTPAPAQEMPDPGGEIRNYPDGPPPPADPGKLLRQKNPVLTWGWTLVVAWANGRTHRRTVLEHVRAGRVVICDRYVLDSLTHLRYRYGPARRFRIQGWIIRLLSPKPVAAFLLDVSPETARARKPEQYTTEDLRVLQSLYRAEAARLKVMAIDPERDEEEVAAGIARATWRRLAP